MDKLPRAEFRFFLHGAYVHSAVLLDPRFTYIRPATRAEVRLAALADEVLGR